ncbi:ethyl tert-butyl ether degradation protein EthD [Pararobbsia silviterrae]|uniref:Ethyl tert-butyl ether degradation protein EthD n=1 Tax=Pararobbsia silviterrae TaxID=1792498 RepID=A0A494WZH6_9BURK|nr:ethyl tert-butyl ether degradation protein EthD [Pararobbsia silviterrae]RKP43925.1 ethyl tert-butyl ether degradation protein EthD [Pararobbsia silviterrae]
MDLCLFLQWQPKQAHPTPAELGTLESETFVKIVESWSQSVEGLERAVLHMPVEATDRYLNDRNGPVLTLQCYFKELAELEYALCKRGSFAELLTTNDFAGLSAHPALEITQQAMAVRAFELDRGAPHVGGTRCTYQVTYTSTKDNVDAWLDDYLAHHVPLLKTQPGLLELEVYTRLDWTSSLDCRRGGAVQRNKAVFADPSALSSALHSPVRDALHRHSQNAPDLQGASTHYPMESRVVHFAREHA